MPRVFSDLSTAKYKTPGHPEAPERVTRSFERLKAAGLAPEPPDIKATEEDVLLVHSEGHLDSVKKGTFSDPDTAAHPGIHKVALTSLSGALSAAAAARAGTKAFSLMRPPGHHAAREKVAGFCYYNNVAISCSKELKAKSVDKIAILDIDVHHGDGTEAIVAKKDGLFFVSLHQSPLYPGTGLKSNDNCMNYPLPAGTAELDYLRTLNRAIEAILRYGPDLLAVSAGFDTYKECPIAQFKLEKKTYRRIGAMIAETRLRRFAVLEGGYAYDLPILIEEFLTGFFG